MSEDNPQPNLPLPEGVDHGPYPFPESEQAFHQEAFREETGYEPDESDMVPIKAMHQQMEHALSVEEAENAGRIDHETARSLLAGPVKEVLRSANEIDKIVQDKKSSAPDGSDFSGAAEIAKERLGVNLSAPEAKEKELTPVEQRALSWLQAAYEESAREHARKNNNRREVEVSKNVPSGLPRNIEAGSMEAEIWRAEQADTETIVEGGMTSPELDRWIKQHNKLGKMASNIRGTDRTLWSGKWVENPPLDPKVVSGIAELESQRQSALQEQASDPLPIQMAVLRSFNII